MESDFKQYIPNVNSKALKELKDVSWNIKKTGDYSAHNVPVVPTYEKLIAKQGNFQNLVNLLNDIIQKIPQDNKILESDKTLLNSDSKGIEWQISLPSYFPDLFEIDPLKPIFFNIEFEVKNLNTYSINLYIYIESQTQPIVFFIDNPVKKFNWRKFRKEEKEFFLNASQDDCIPSNELTKFIFTGLYRPKFIRIFQKQIILRYRITGKSVGTKEKYFYDTQLRRLVVPIQKKSERRKKVATPSIDTKETQ